MGVIEPNKSAASRLRKQIAESNAEDRGAIIEREFIEQLDAYYASPASSFYDNVILHKLYRQKIAYLGWKDWAKDGVITFGASGTNKCDLEVFFRNQRVKPQKSEDIPFRGRQRRQGTAVVDYVQMDLLHMPKVLGDKAKFIIPVEDNEWLFEDAAEQRKVFEVDGVKFAITCKPDGILEYDSERLIFEYKTKASGLKSMNSKLDYKGPDESHIRQITAESLVFGIREAVILYESNQKPSWFSDEESKSVTKGQRTWADGRPLADIRAFYVYITDEMQAKLLTDLAKQAKIVYDGIQPKVTVDCVQQCGFCPYKAHCRSVISPENLAELQEIEAGYARSNFTGNSEHRKLVEYLG